MKKKRIENALWGLFISDAISMPAHWFYRLDYLKETFGSITGYNDAPHPHPESFMVGNGYEPDIISAKQLGRPYDILHNHLNFYQTPYSHLDIQTMHHSGEHANAMPQLQERFHYHHELKAGENTLGAQLVRVLMRSVIKNGAYDQNAFLEDFVTYMSTPGLNKDPYCEIYIRAWFENYTRGVPIDACAQQQRNVWSIGSHGGIIRPLILSLSANNPFKGLGVAVAHQHLTHRSENVTSALSVLVPLLYDLLDAKEPQLSLDTYAKKVPLIKISGKSLSKTYRDHLGPGNIDKNEMWKIHTQYSDHYLDLDLLLETYSDKEIIGGIFATACYPEHGIPLLFTFLKRHKFDFKKSILANANAGGDNVHRGMILGLLAGAATDTIPKDLKLGLVDSETLKTEISEFVSLLKF